MLNNNKIEVNLVKLNGTGNSFVIIENINNNQMSRAGLAKIICSMDLNGPTDGLLFVEKIRTHVYKWDFYNSDGSAAEMCGNAARCVTRYLSEKEKILNTEIEIQTLAGSVFGMMIDKENIKVEMPQVLIEKTQDGYQRINTGVPHLIFPLEQIQLAKTFKDQARKLREKWNANVTFVSLSTTEIVEAVTYERGVEDFTLACGTGAVAAGIWKLNNENKNMPGGRLIIEWDKKLRPYLIGNAVIELTRQITIEVNNESV